MKKYKYAGEGMGLPGLPNDVTDAEAKALGMLDVLTDAVGVGLYVEVKEPVKPKTKVEQQSSKGDVSDG